MTSLVATVQNNARLGREKHVGLTTGFGYLRMRKRDTGTEERAAVLPYELKTLRCPIQRGNDTKVNNS